MLFISVCFFILNLIGKIHRMQIVSIGHIWNRKLTWNDPIDDVLKK